MHHYYLLLVVPRVLTVGVLYIIYSTSFGHGLVCVSYHRSVRYYILYNHTQLRTSMVIQPNLYAAVCVKALDGDFSQHGYGNVANVAAKCGPAREAGKKTLVG